MTAFTDSLYADAKIIPVSQPNRVKLVTMMDDGAMRVEQNSGKVFTIPKEDKIIQAYLIYMVVNTDA